jgi:hypothetical protein
MNAIFFCFCLFSGMHSFFPRDHVSFHSITILSKSTYEHPHQERKKTMNSTSIQILFQSLPDRGRVKRDLENEILREEERIHNLTVSVTKKKDVLAHFPVQLSDKEAAFMGHVVMMNRRAMLDAKVGDLIWKGFEKDNDSTPFFTLWQVTSLGMWNQQPIIRMVRDLPCEITKTGPPSVNFHTGSFPGCDMTTTRDMFIAYMKLYLGTNQGVDIQVEMPSLPVETSQSPVPEKKVEKKDEPPITMKDQDNTSLYREDAELTVFDTVGKWQRARILKVQASQILVHYLGWSDKWDAWIDVVKEADRLSFTRKPDLVKLSSPLCSCDCGDDDEDEESNSECDD